MGKILEIMGRNKLYTVLAVFILLLNLLLLAERFLPAPEEDGQPAAVGTAAVKEELPPEERTLLDEDDEKARQEKLVALSEENPKLYLFLGLFNLTIMFMAFVGLVIDIFLAVRFFGKKPINIRINPQEGPRWGVPDVVRVILLFLSFGYLFVILQAFFVNIFPILNNENFRMVFNTAMMNIVGISVIFYFVSKKHGQDVRELGITGRKLKKGVLYAVTGYVALMPVLIAIMIATYFVTKLFQYKPPVQPIVEVFIREKETMVLWFSTLFAAVFGPVAEEIFFRGFMYTAIRKHTGALWAMLITAAIFAFLHAHLVGFMPILALGVLLTYLYEKTGSLVPSIVVHVLHNVGMVFVVFLVRYIG